MGARGWWALVRTIVLNGQYLHVLIARSAAGIHLSAAPRHIILAHQRLLPFCIALYAVFINRVRLSGLGASRGGRAGAVCLRTRHHHWHGLQEGSGRGSGTFAGNKIKPCMQGTPRSPWPNNQSAPSIHAQGLLFLSFFHPPSAAPADATPLAPCLPGFGRGSRLARRRTRRGSPSAPQSCCSAAAPALRLAAAGPPLRTQLHSTAAPLPRWAGRAAGLQ